MYRYQPPKSSIWGHSLRKMPAKRASELLKEFLTTTTAEFKFAAASLMLSGAPEPTLHRFEQLVGAPAKNAVFSMLNESQCQACVDEFIREEITGYILLQSFNITKWRIGDQVVGTTSQINMNYGVMPCMSTFFVFETVDQFHFIRQALEKLGLCKLNEKHLKPVRGKKA